MTTQYAGILLLLLGLFGPDANRLHGADGPNRCGVIFAPSGYASLTDAPPLHQGAVALRDLLLQSGFSDEQLVLLDAVDANSPRAATAANLRRHLARLADYVGRDDLLLVAIAAQGVQINGRDYVCTTDTSAADLAGSDSQPAPATLVGLQEIVRTVAVAASQNRILLVDNGGSANPFPNAAGVANGSELADRFGSQPLQVPGGQWIVCSRSGRLHEAQDGTPAVTCFMASLLDGLRVHADTNGNGDGQISAFEISDHVQRYAEQQGSAPPVLHGKTNVDFAVATASERPATVASLPVALRQQLSRNVMRAGYAALIGENDALGAAHVFSDAGDYLPSQDLTRENFGLYLSALAAMGQLDKAFALATQHNLPLLAHVPSPTPVYEQDGVTPNGNNRQYFQNYGQPVRATVPRGTLLLITEVSPHRARFEQTFTVVVKDGVWSYEPGKIGSGWVDTISLKAPAR